jgi:hypothetical protein
MIFDTPARKKGDEEWLFAAVYDSRDTRENKPGNPPGLSDKGRKKDKHFSAGVFLLYPTQSQSLKYLTESSQTRFYYIHGAGFVKMGIS